VALILQTPSALNVDIPGTAGSFKVTRHGQEASAVEVQYLLTHVTLGAAGPQQQLLDMLAPVREVFDLEQLGFDEIMQRDIDDSRVSMDLIPYLLDHTNTGMVKLFPPIVVVVLPLVEISNRPAERYATVQHTKEPVSESPGYHWDYITAGGVGHEQFQLRRLLRQDGTFDPTNAMLRLARGNCALAIVDGQHRAMALLALYRNLTQNWSDARRSMYQQYYGIWSEADIRGFDLKELQMPMIICTFPQLDGAFQGDIDVIRAARRVFLDLNKNAKKVSDSRNKLLDDQDMVSQCLRAMLADVKRFDVRNSNPLRIWNIELDQAQDRSIISSDVALSGVSHLYYIVEHLLFASDRVKGISGRKGRLARSRRLDDAYTRFGLMDILTTQERTQNTRTNYSDKVATKVEERWCLQYGNPLEQMLGEFYPFLAHCRASLKIDQQLKAHNKTKLRSLIFDGQASSRTFGDFQKRLDLKIGDDPSWQTPELKAIRDDVDAQVREHSAETKRFRLERSRAFLSEVRGAKSRSLLSADDTVPPIVQELMDSLYREVFTSIAFQAAIFLTLVETFEEAHATQDGTAPPSLTPENVTEYLNSLHRLFRPTTYGMFERLVGAFRGNLVENDNQMTLAATNRTFGHLVVPGEMQPDEWPKYRYVILEIWSTNDQKIQEIINADLDEARPAIMRAAFKRSLEAYCAEGGKLEQDITPDERGNILNQVVERYEEFLMNVRGARFSLAQVAAQVRPLLGFLSPQDDEEQAS
jgi:hypothetical protein